MDLKHNHGSLVYVVRACYNDDAIDLIALGGEHTVEILQVTSSSSTVVASFHVGTRITALAWSSRTVSSSSSDQWFIELAVAGADFGLFLLSKSGSVNETIMPFGGGLSGHHGKVNDMSFCGGRGEDSHRYVATVSDDKMLMVWDLDPALDIASVPSPGSDASSSSSPRPQPTAYVITFPHPLTTVNSHPSTGKDFLVSDCRGSIFITDWRSDPDESDQGNWRHSNLVELVEPCALSDAMTGLSVQWTGSAAWRRDAVDIIGATYGTRFSIWDITKLEGGKPSLSGVSFPEGGGHFRWCQSYPDYFAISNHLSPKGAVIHVHNMAFIHAQPNVITIAPRPHHIRDFDFLASRGIPRIVAAVGSEVLIFSIAAES
ncbi:hypothetical protein FIBSPDRAFT_1041985 [Athelia psychrophila]|uniref:Uncharacterized protein n=1 Tax=Athelia psychrophila TaxID=1759441 RepID=A0A166NCQ0_9AGAM|nr:hypothetical protein FIBSPDRAFT_1041985 [Fibularhizoctonia sp. CBS 109695]